eukprot:CFRG5798T1
MGSNSIAVFTSGGDAPGMNAVIYSVARIAMHYKRDIYAIYEGYQGLIDGKENIRKLEWDDVGLIMHRGGTIIGSARCPEMRERKGRLIACKNLVDKNITNLICCGGDGSLTGANLFRLEWTSLLEELVATNQITSDDATRCSHLNLVGLVGSIDNDMVYEGELTIGTDTALHRIIEAIDAVHSTASSHQRTFVLEVMGRHCGYLAWAAGIATGADFILIPEAPPQQDDWENIMCSKLEKRRRRGKRLNTVIVAEGAIDKHCKEISSDYVKDIIVKRLSHDTRITILGHVQRGGKTSAYDRLLGTISGAAAVEKVLNAEPGDAATIVGLRGMKIVFEPLVEAVKATQRVAELTAKKDFKGAIVARGKNFERDYDFHRAINGTDPKVPVGTHPLSVGIICCGAPAGGINSACRAAVRYAMNFGCRVYGVHNGFSGFEAGDLREVSFMEVSGWSGEGGAKLGVNRSLPSNLQKIAAVMAEYKMGALLVLGGFEALGAVVTLEHAKKDYKDMQIPICLIPATISNNVPGTDYSIGCDTGVNAVADAIDRCKVSAYASRHRVFIVETQGGNCGFLALLGALTSGADVVYTREEGVTLERMLGDLEQIKKRMAEGHKYSVVVRNEHCSSTYTLAFMKHLFEEEGKGTFSVRTCRLGHMCQGLYPSPLDRVRGAQLAAHAVKELLRQMDNNEHESFVTGKVNGELTHSNILELCETDADFENRCTKSKQWMVLLPLVRQLAKYGVDNPVTYYSAATREMLSQ